MADKNISKIVNLLLLIFFIWIVINAIIMQFHLITPLANVKAIHVLGGWIFIGLMLIHILLHLKYYKMIFIRRKNGK